MTEIVLWKTHLNQLVVAYIKDHPDELDIWSFLRYVEKAFCSTVLQDLNGNQTKTAKRLNMSRGKLRSVIRGQCDS